MDANLITLYQNILETQGIQFLLLSQSDSGWELSDYGFRKKIYENYNYQNFSHNILSNTNDSAVFYFRDDFQLNYCFFLFPEILREEYQADYALIGPVMFHFITLRNLEQILETHLFPLSMQKDFIEFYNRIPTLPSQDFWVSLLNPLLRPLFGNADDYQFIDMSAFLNKESAHQISPVTSEISFDAIADRYDAEKQMRAAVAQGNAEDAIKFYHKFRQFNTEARTPDILRNQKNWLVILNTVLRLSVEQAYVHPYYIDELSKEFAIQIESTNNMPQLESLSATMLRKYSMLAHNYSTREYSPLIQKCVDHIRFFFQESLSLTSLAKHCSVNSSYLSIQFHKETGSTITDYIQDIRMNHALLLLNSTKYSVLEIAHQCGFSDSNYFTRVFKKRTGMTPKAYRKNL